MVTVGTFDGVHEGHRALMEKLVRTKTSRNAHLMFVITFDPSQVLFIQNLQAYNY